MRLFALLLSLPALVHATFTMPAVLKRAWMWWDKERVRKYACGIQQGQSK